MLQPNGLCILANLYGRKALNLPASNHSKEIITMDKYVCPCGYEYDPAVGDPDNGVAPGTPWEAVPADWVCPVCGMGKDVFEMA